MVFQFLARLILRNRFYILIAVSVVTVFMAIMIFRLRFYYEPTPLLPKSDSLLVQYREFNKIFGKGENIMVIGVADSNFFSTEKFAQWRLLKKNLHSIEGVEHVLSISDIYTLNRNSNQKVFEFQQIFPDSITSQQQLDSLKEIALSLPFYRGMLYNAESNIYLMMVTLKSEMISTKERIPLMEKIVETCEVYSNSTGNKLRYSGLPYIRITVGEMIRGEMYLFIILAALVTAIILFLLFRSFRIVMFSMLVVAVSVTWGLGFMGILGYEITLLTAVIPPLIIVIGVPNCIFLLNKYHREYSLHGNKV
jgi:predicted RND superfamily exporter protein